MLCVFFGTIRDALCRCCCVGVCYSSAVAHHTRKVGRENVALQHEMGKLQFFKEQAEMKLRNEEDAAKQERQYVA